MKKILLSMAVLFSITKLAMATGHTITITPTNALCNDVCDGTATASVAGGSGNFEYVWSPTGGSSATAISLCPGTYTCVVTDINDFTTASNTVVITEPNKIEIYITSTPDFCGASQGSIKIDSIRGGTPDYTPIWDVCTQWPQSPCPNPLTGLAVSTYTLTVTDKNNCSVTLSTIVDGGPLLTVSTTTTPADSGKNNGSATAYTTGGTGTYTYSWSSPAFGNPAISLVCGTYTVTVTDAYNCSSVSIAIVDCVPTAINELTASSQFSMYPNPAGSTVTIEPVTNKPYTLQLVNILGETVYYTQQNTSNKIFIDIGLLPKGVYMVQVQTEDGSKNIKQKLLVQ